jgi:hypothetical protein
VRRAIAHFASAMIALPIVAASFAACSLGEGNGKVYGDLNVHECWSGPFNLNPDFFAAVPYRDSLQLRIQNGGDFQTFSDGLSILIDDIWTIRPHDMADGGFYAGELGKQLSVSLPPEVTPPGIPIVPTDDPARVHIVLYLQRTCRTQNVALYAMDSVSLNANGNCDALDGGQPVFTCPKQWPDGTPVSSGDDAGSAFDAGGDAGASAEASAAPQKVGHSWISFTSIFNNNVEESRADNRRNEGKFELYLADPRELCPGGIGPPPPCRGHIQGDFKFYFERGRPGQPFP